MQRLQSNKITQLDAKDTADIINKVEIETAQSHHNMIKLGAIANILSGIFIIWILYGHAKVSTFVIWFSILLILNIINVAWAMWYQNVIYNPSELKHWRHGFIILFSAICLTWGTLGIVFASNNPLYELYTITFLQVVILGFSFSSLTDFTLAILSLSCLALPTIIFRFYLAINSILKTGHDTGLNTALGLSLLILASFLLAVCYFGAKLVKKFFFLNFANTVLNQKLEEMNEFLEERVRERTIELEKSLKLVTYQATHDLLTDLPNQRLLYEYINTAIEKVNMNQHSFAVACFAINEIEKINDGLGHHIGDQIIKKVADRLIKRFSNSDNDNGEHNDGKLKYTVCLSRKDVFVILVDIITDTRIEEKIKPIFDVLNNPVSIQKHSIKLTASIGVSIYPQDGDNAKLLLMNADAAMIHAKMHGGNNLNIYQATLNADVSKELELASFLHEAVDKREFIVQYQPFVDAKTGKICGAEALLRWQHPTLGFIPPINFIPLAEANGVIIPLGEWVLRTACQQVKMWHSMGFGNLKVAVNLSARQLLQKNILKTIVDILKENQLGHEFIELELTETEAFREEVLPVIRQFKALGFSISIDDFGTGYSGLSNLKLISINKLKIDKSFVSDVNSNISSQAIVKNIISLAKSIHVQVLAEGVETKDQLSFLQKNDCDLIQGFYFSPALNADQFTDLLNNRKIYPV